MYYKQGSKLDPEFREAYAEDCIGAKKPAKVRVQGYSEDDARALGKTTDREEFLPYVEVRLPEPQDGNRDLIPR